MSRIVASIMAAVSLSGFALTGPVAPVRAASSAPQIVFSSDREGGYQLYAAERNGNNPRRLTFDTHVNFAPAASPDKKQVAYISRVSPDDPGALRLLTVATLQSNTVLEDKTTDYINPTWSPDGKKLAFGSISTDGGYKSCINVLTLSTLVAEKILCGSTLVHSPDWSPDGQKILYTEFHRSTGGKLFTVDLRLSGQKKFVVDGFAASFSPMGDKIAYTAYDSAYVNQVVVAHSDGSSPRRLTQGTFMSTASDWASDGFITYVSVHPQTYQFQVKSITPDGATRIDMTTKTSEDPGQGLL